jgi:hypothetical protein
VTPETALLKAAVAALKDAAGVTDLVAERVYDDVPDERSGEQTPPYIYIGPINRSRIETGCDPQWTMRMRVYAVSTAFGRLEAWDVANAVAEALEGKVLTLDQPFHCGDIVRAVQAGDVIDPSNPKATFVDISTIVAKGDTP